MLLPSSLLLRDRRISKLESNLSSNLLSKLLLSKRLFRVISLRLFDMKEFEPRPLSPLLWLLEPPTEPPELSLDRILLELLLELL